MSALRRSQRLEALEVTTGGPSTVGMAEERSEDVEMLIPAPSPSPPLSYYDGQDLDTHVGPALLFRRPSPPAALKERREAGAHRNRIHAKNSRHRRKAQSAQLERHVGELEEENRRLPVRAGVAPSAPTVSFGSNSQAGVARAQEREDEELEERPSKALQRYTKHETHWLLDGNVMLQIESVRFKIHRSRLAGESSWFKPLLNKRSGLATEGDRDWHEIDPVLEADEIVDGCDLFYLDVPDDLCPTAADFAELLTAMDNAIDYTRKTPEFPILARIFKAASFFRFDRYSRFSFQALQELFPDTPSSIGFTPIPYAAEVIVLARTHRIPATLRCAFYELARRPPVNPGPVANGGTLGPDTQDSALLLEALPHDDVYRFLALQKHLALSWKGIYKAASYTCQPSTNLTCKTQHSGSTIVAGLQMEQILDPIRALNELIGRDWTQDAFCPASANRVRQALTNTRTEIWQNMANWLDIVVESD